MTRQGVLEAAFGFGLEGDAGHKDLKEDDQEKKAGRSEE